MIFDPLSRVRERVRERGISNWKIRALALLLAAALLFWPLDRAHAVYSRRTVVTLNIGISAVLGAVGAAFYAKSGQRLQRFWEGFFYGSLGGGLIWFGKYAATEIPDHGIAGWTSKGMVSTGSSITENVLNGRAPLSSWSMDFGPLWMTFNCSGLGKRPLELKVLPVASGALVDMAARPGTRFDAKKTLRTGTLTFRTERPFRENTEAAGAAIANSVVIVESKRFAEVVFPHEVIHTYQWRQGTILDSIYEPYWERYRISKFVKPDLAPGIFVRAERSMGYTSKKRTAVEEQEADFFSSLYEDKMIERLGYRSWELP